MTYEQLLDYLNKNDERILKNTEAFAVGIGKDSKGEYLLQIHVEDAASLKKTDQLEKILSGSENPPYEIIEEPAPQYDILYVDDEIPAKAIQAKETAVDEDNGRYRPMLGGIQINVRRDRKSWVGTLSCFVKSRDETDTNLYLLSNLHVLKEVGLAVNQPLLAAKNIIATACRTEDYENTDAALALVNDPDIVSPNLIQQIGEVTQSRALTAKDIGKRVCKRGRTTAFTEGTISSIHTSVDLGGGVIRKDCVTVQADPETLFSNSGDSGSPVVLCDENVLVGLHFASNQKLGGQAYFCKISHVFDRYNIKLPD